jgi:hypothetical protein
MFKLFNRKRQAGASDSTYLVGLAILVGILASWFTHIVVCIKAGSWGFLIAGAIFFPVAVIHGVGIWFGFF